MQKHHDGGDVECNVTSRSFSLHRRERDGHHVDKKSVRE